MRKIITASLIALALSACQEGAAITCPPLQQYSAAYLKAAAAELAQVERTSPHLVQMLDDYRVSRAAIRACLKRRK